MLSKLQKVRSLPAGERWLLAQALVLLPMTYWGVFALGVNRWQRILAKLGVFHNAVTRNFTTAGNPDSQTVFAPAEPEAITERARTIARTVQIAAHHRIYQASCLQQALVLWLLLRRNHIESEILFGARKEGDQLQAHAWVECQGLALNEEKDVCEHFLPLNHAEVGTAQSFNNRRY